MHDKGLSRSSGSSVLKVCASPFASSRASGSPALIRYNVNERASQTANGAVLMAI
jgi:hypothetical protein